MKIIMKDIEMVKGDILIPRTSRTKTALIRYYSLKPPTI